ncbi:MAG: hypothetical protein U9O94_08435 [Nanoarchaeota archaeon]|nr:hypothetical protein [Nanoarchaeota archaeon]
MAKKEKNIFVIGMVALAALALFKDNIAGTLKFSIVDTLLPSATNLEQNIIFYGVLAIIAVILIQSFFWKRNS